MKVFQGDNSSWSTKINFVDKNDVFVGFDYSQDCCEFFGWFIDNKINETIDYDIAIENEGDFDIEKYSFDKKFFKEFEGESFDSGGMVVFKLKAKGKPPIYLHLFNSHNGYYGHGFEVKHGGETIKEGYL